MQERTIVSLVRFANQLEEHGYTYFADRADEILYAFAHKGLSSRFGVDVRVLDDPESIAKQKKQKQREKRSGAGFLSDPELSRLGRGRKLFKAPELIAMMTPELTAAIREDFFPIEMWTEVEDNWKKELYEGFFEDQASGWSKGEFENDKALKEHGPGWEVAAKKFKTFMNNFRRRVLDNLKVSNSKVDALFTSPTGLITAFLSRLVLGKELKNKKYAELAPPRLRRALDANQKALKVQAKKILLRQARQMEEPTRLVDATPEEDQEWENLYTALDRQYHLYEASSQLPTVLSDLRDNNSGMYRGMSYIADLLEIDKKEKYQALGSRLAMPTMSYIVTEMMKDNRYLRKQGQEENLWTPKKIQNQFKTLLSDLVLVHRSYKTAKEKRDPYTDFPDAVKEELRAIDLEMIYARGAYGKAYRQFAKTDKYEDMLAMESAAADLSALMNMKRTKLRKEKGFWSDKDEEDLQGPKIKPPPSNVKGKPGDKSKGKSKNKPVGSGQYGHEQAIDIVDEQLGKKKPSGGWLYEPDPEKEALLKKEKKVKEEGEAQKKRQAPKVKKNKEHQAIIQEMKILARSFDAIDKKVAAGDHSFAEGVEAKKQKKQEWHDFLQKHQDLKAEFYDIIAKDPSLKHSLRQLKTI